MKNKEIVYLFYLLTDKDKFYTYEQIKQINKLINKLIKLLEN